jgi:hypothetical protein
MATEIKRYRTDSEHHGMEEYFMGEYCLYRDCTTIAYTNKRLERELKLAHDILLPKEGEVWTKKICGEGRCSTGWSLGTGTYTIEGNGFNWGTLDQIACGCLLKADAKHCTTPSVSNIISLWLEGFSATGQRQGASMIGTYQAKDLDDAVKQHMETHKGDVDWNSVGGGRHSIWGCGIFDNEKEARKSFG